ncbi:MAG: hypothetical protein MUD02_01620 [Bacteroidales bacterium]|jgi:uncharacterized membrane protein|nr:hypothetical protein [Bacteroidales bacterium]MCU0407622.1 hypothetical protein [Bacteroidales bacterium]
MKQLRFFAIITAVLGFLSVLALFFLYMSLADIAHNEPDQGLEWRIAGICMLVLASFVISTFVTLGFMLKKLNLRDVPQS